MTEALEKAKRKYEGKRIKMSVSFNEEKDKELNWINKEYILMKHIVVWSGGCDSTLILLDLIKKGVQK